MAKENATSTMADFSFDSDADWNFGTPAKDNTTVAEVTKSVQGSTIDDSVDDDDGEATDLEAEKGKPKPAPKEEAVVGTPDKPKKEKIEDTTKKNKEKEEDEDEEDTEDFSDFNEKPQKKDKEVVANKKKADEPEEDDKEFFNALALEMKEKGIFEHIELPKDKVLTEEEFFELHDEEIEARAAASVEEWAKDLDEDAKAFIKHKRAGGSTKEFVEVYYGSGIDLENFDATDEAMQDSLIRYYVTNFENLDTPQDIEDRIQTIKDKGQAETKAEQWAEKLKKIEAKNKSDLEKAQRDRDKDKADNAKKFNKQLTEVLTKTDAVGAFPINKMDQKELGEYITKPKVKVTKGYVPQFQNDLAKILKAETVEDQKKLLLLAKLVKTDFDASDILPKAETAVVRRANSLLQRNKKGVRPNSAGSYMERALADQFE